MSKPMKVVYAGTPEFAVPPLQYLLDSKYSVIAVYTQPDRPAGRGRKLQASPVKALAVQNQIPVYQPQSFKSPEDVEALKALSPDLMIVVAYGLLLPEAVLTIPRFGCINIHASLLPKWRGAAPIQRSILAGDQQTGVTLMQMDKGLDTGDILVQRSIALDAQQTSQMVHDQLSVLGAQTLLECLPDIESDAITPIPQDNAQASYAEKLDKKEAWIDWSDDANSIAQKVQAFNPWPVAQTHYEQDGKRHTLRIWLAQALPGSTDEPCGCVVQVNKAGIDVSAGKGVLRILKLQRSGGKPMQAAEFINAIDVTQFKFLLPPEAVE